MLERKPIIGEKVVSILDGRITLPTFTGIETGDTLQAQFVTTYNSLTNTNEVHHLNIYSVEEFEERLNKIDRMLYEAYASKRINHIQYENYMNYFYGYLSFQEQTVDSKRRLHLEPRIIKELKINTNAFLVGIKNHLELYPTIESYTSTLKEVYYRCTEEELPFIIEGNIPKDIALLTDTVPNNREYLCVYRIPPVILFNNNNYGIYMIPSSEINKTFLECIISPNNEIVYKKETISFNML